MKPTKLLGETPFTVFSFRLFHAYEKLTHEKLSTRLLSVRFVYRLEFFFLAGTIHCVMCNWCQKEPLHGMIWKCARCYGYVLCTQCYMNGVHCLEHDFVRISTPDSPETK